MMITDRCKNNAIVIVGRELFVGISKFTNEAGALFLGIHNKLYHNLHHHNHNLCL